MSSGLYFLVKIKLTFVVNEYAFEKWLAIWSWNEEQVMLLPVREYVCYKLLHKTKMILGNVGLKYELLM